MSFNPMNNLPPYYTYPNTPNQQAPPYPTQPPLPKIQEIMEETANPIRSFLNIGRMNRGKICIVHYSLNKEVYQVKGIIEDIGEDYYLICDPKNGKRYLLRFSNIYYLEFDDEIKY